MDKQETDVDLDLEPGDYDAPGLPGVAVIECSNPDHKHDSKHPIPAGGCPDPRQDASPAPEPGAKARLNCQIPTELEERVQQECADRMIGVGLLVTKALEKFLDELPPAL